MKPSSLIVSKFVFLLVVYYTVFEELCNKKNNFDFLFTAQMPEKYRKNKVKPRGVSNRNRALEWIKANATDGVLYFADDDNTYDVDIFTEVRLQSYLLIHLYNSIFSTYIGCLIQFFLLFILINFFHHLKNKKKILCTFFHV